VRLVLLGAAVAHRRGRENSAACELALKIVAKCGEADRKYKNCLLFLAADETRLDELRSAIRTSLSWKKILDDKTIWVELTGAQQQTARERSSEGEKDVNRLLRTCWSYGFSPEQEATVGAPITLAEIRVEGGNSAAEALSRKLEAEGKLVPIFGGVNLRLELDRKSLWRDRDYIPLRELTEDTARYPYVTRLKDETVLANSVRDGIGKTTWDVETFAYADAYDEGSGAYLGLAAGGNAGRLRSIWSAVYWSSQTSRPLNSRAHASAVDATAPDEPPSSAETGSGRVATAAVAAPSVAAAVRPHRFFQRITVTDPTLLPRVVNKLANDIVALLAAKGAKVEIAIDVSAELADGYRRATRGPTSRQRECSRVSASRVRRITPRLERRGRATGVEVSSPLQPTVGIDISATLGGSGYLDVLRASTRQGSPQKRACRASPRCRRLPSVRPGVGDPP
jgi:hypothetical protein